MKPSYPLFVTDTATTLGSVRTINKIVNPAVATHYSRKMAPDEHGNLGFTLETTGTLEATPTLWYSDKERPDVTSDADWDQDTSWTPTAIAGSATKEKYVVTGLRAAWCRVKVAVTAGAGELSGNANY